MPVVLSSSGSAGDQLQLVKNGFVKRISAFVPGDDGGSVPAVLSNFQNMGTKTKTGLHFDADLLFCTHGEYEASPQKYGRVEDGMVRKVRVHLCGKKSCTYHSCKLHLGEWAYHDEDEDDRSPAAVATLKPGERVLLLLLDQENAHRTVVAE